MVVGAPLLPKKKTPLKTFKYFEINSIKNGVSVGNRLCLMAEAENRADIRGREKKHFK